MDADILARLADVLAHAAAQCAALALEARATMPAAASQQAPQPEPVAAEAEPAQAAPEAAQQAPEADHKAAARRIFEYWARRTGHDRARFTPERARKVLARLRDGYSERDILRAIDGCASSPWHNGSADHSDGTRYDDLELICRTGAKLERFMELSSASLPEPTQAKPSAEDDEKSRAMSEARRALKEGKTDEYNRIIRAQRGR